MIYPLFLLVEWLYMRHRMIYGIIMVSHQTKPHKSYINTMIIIWNKYFVNKERTGIERMKGNKKKIIRNIM